MSTTLYMTDHEDRKFDDPCGGYVGDLEFYNLVAECEHETVTISEYDAQYEIRPNDFETLRKLMKVHPQIQEIHFKFVDLLEEKKSRFLGLGY